MKKLLALLLALCMCVGLLTACGSTEAPAASATAVESEAEPADEAPVEEASVPVGETVALDSTVEGTEGQTVAVTVGDPMEAMAEQYISYPIEGDNTITLWYYQPPYQQFVDSNANFNCLATAEEKTGVHLEFTEVSQSSASEQFNLMVAGGDMADLIPCMEYYTGGVAKAYEEGIIQDIEAYVDEYMPNYAAVRDCLAPETVKATKTEDMTLVFYQIKDGTYSGNGMVTRGDWLEKLNWEWSGETITLDEFEDYLRTVKSEFDVPYPIYMYDGTVAVEAAFDTEIPVLVGDGFMTSVSSAIFRYDDEVASAWTTDAYREYLAWVLKMMDEGIIPKDYLSLDTDRGTTNSLQANGGIAIWTSNADKLEEIVDWYGADNPDLAVAAMPRVTKDPSAPFVWAEETALVSTMGGFSLSATCENPELVCEWENYFWTEEGYYVLNYGTEGESFHYTDDGALFDWNQPQTITGSNAPNAEMAVQLFTMCRFAGGYIDNDILLPTFPESALKAVELWQVDGMVDNRNYPSTAKASMTVEETQELSSIENDFLTYADETCMKFLSGDLELNDENWNDYIEKCDQMGINDIVAIYQSVYDEFKAGTR